MSTERDVTREVREFLRREHEGYLRGEPPHLRCLTCGSPSPCPMTLILDAADRSLTLTEELEKLADELERDGQCVELSVVERAWRKHHAKTLRSSPAGRPTDNHRGLGFAATHDKRRPDEWRVETYGEDGVTYQWATFTGTMSEERAMAYLRWLESLAPKPAANAPGGEG